MKFAAAFCLVCCFALAQSWVSEDDVLVTQRLVDHVNSAATTWTASLEQGDLISGATVKQVKSLCGTLRGGPILPLKTEFEVAPEDVPDEFNSQTNWPHCATMFEIRDQSSCGSCWAFAAVEAMSDRICIFNNKNVSLSAQDMNSCCGFSCGDGCNGGYPSGAWNYYKRAGIVDRECSPYTLPSCDHHIANSTNPCPEQEYKTPPCVKTCNNTETWESALHLGATAYSVRGATAIQQEIFTNGPVETAFTVYEDFLTYSGGVYQHTTGSAVGGHAVKFLGWGVENGVDYWLVANSWNPDWGLNGYFKILRGVNECGIESEVYGGVPVQD